MAIAAELLILIKIPWPTRGLHFINDTFHREASIYRTLDFRSQNMFGVDRFSAPGPFEGATPYERVAFEPQMGARVWSRGIYGPRPFAPTTDLGQQWPGSGP